LERDEAVEVLEKIIESCTTQKEAVVMQKMRLYKQRTEFKQKA